jgi:hypothetical protein
VSAPPAPSDCGRSSDPVGAGTVSRGDTFDIGKAHHPPESLMVSLGLH